MKNLLHSGIKIVQGAATETKLHVGRTVVNNFIVCEQIECGGLYNVHKIYYLPTNHSVLKIQVQILCLTTINTMKL